jgi:hypothetical protein
MLRRYDAKVVPDAKVVSVPHTLGGSPSHFTALVPSRPGTQLLRCQYLYFCASKASKLSTFGVCKRRPRAEGYVQSPDRHIKQLVLEGRCVAEEEGLQRFSS